MGPLQLIWKDTIHLNISIALYLIQENTSTKYNCIMERHWPVQLIPGFGIWLLESSSTLTGVFETSSQGRVGFCFSTKHSDKTWWIALNSPSIMKSVPKEFMNGIDSCCHLKNAHAILRMSENHFCLLKMIVHGEKLPLFLVSGNSQCSYSKM